mgnify:CR=1 FL=1
MDVWGGILGTVLNSPRTEQITIYLFFSKKLLTICEHMFIIGLHQQINVRKASVKIGEKYENS